LETILFFFAAVVAIASALGMLTSRSPVNSALWLVLNFFCIAALYILLNAQFIGVIQVLVYAGAIMVLFLFVIMLLNLESLPRIRDIDWKKVVAFVIGMVILAQIVYVVVASVGGLPDPASVEQAAELGTTQALGEELFTRYVFPLEVIAVMLLAATIGAVLLSKKRFV
jgi:NADH-quinone oxidoreductase subunit J